MGNNRFLSVSFQGHLQNIYYSKDSVEEKSIYDLLSKFEMLSSNLLTSPPLLYLIDYTKSSYLVMTDATKAITSYDPRDFLDGGIPQLIDIFQPDDFKVYNTLVFPANIAFLQQHKDQPSDKFVFSYNFRVKAKNGQFVTVLQRGSYITSPNTGLPLFSLGYVIDISAFKRDRLIYHTIEEIDNDSSFIVKNRLVENFFYPYEEDKILSRREKCILTMMADGLSSKQIAGKLHISENTIANHRKNMLRKTSTGNVAQLIAYACKSGII
jgi:DNA-binding CsgD family transcriptional regulator